jgi:hypothetical protein
LHKQSTCEVEDSYNNSSTSCRRFTGFSRAFFCHGCAKPFVLVCSGDLWPITCGRLIASLRSQLIAPRLAKIEYYIEYLSSRSCPAPERNSALRRSGCKSRAKRVPIVQYSSTVVSLFYFIWCLSPPGNDLVQIFRKSVNDTQYDTGTDVLRAMPVACFIIILRYLTSTATGRKLSSSYG